VNSKKSLYIVVAVVLLLLVGGASYMKLKGNKVTSPTSNSATESKGIFASVKDALSKKMTLVCEFKDEKNVSVKSYIKNGAVRVTSTGGTTENQSGDIIIKDKKMYMWDVKTKQGFVYDIPDSDTNNIGTSSGNEASLSENYLNMIDKYKDSCEIATVEDSYFTPPTDVKFQDMSKLLEDLKKQMPQTPQQ